MAIVKYQDSIADSSTGRPIANVNVQVFEYPSGDAAIIYDSASAISTAAVVTDSDGAYSFYAEDGHYNIVYYYGGITKTLVDVLIGGIPGAPGPASSGYTLLSSYGSLAAMVATVGTDSQTVGMDVDDTLSTNLVIPANIELLPFNGAVINYGSYTISYAGSTARWPLAQMFNGTGAVTGLKEAKPEYFGAVGGGVTDDTVAVTMADLASVNGAYLTTSYKVSPTFRATRKARGPGSLVSYSGLSTPTRITGTGLNDIAFSGTYSGSLSHTFRVKIAANGTPDEIAISPDGGATWATAYFVYNPTTDGFDSVAFTASTTPIEIYSGVSVAFAATTGHTVGDTWEIVLAPKPHVAGGAEDSLYLRDQLFAHIPEATSTAVGAGTFGNETNVGGGNTAVGSDSQFYNTTGFANTSLGLNTLKDNKTGAYNVAIGNTALQSNVSGSSNLAAGVYTLYGNTTGSVNTAVGNDAMRYAVSGTNNIAMGDQAMYMIESGEKNTALGVNASRGGAGTFPTHAALNYTTSVGANSLFNGAGDYSVAVGMEALYSNLAGGTGNTAIGTGAGFRNTSGYNNIFLGYLAGSNIAQKVDAINTIAIGYNTVTTVNNTAVIGKDLVDMSLSGLVHSDEDNTRDLGTSAKRWKTVYAGTGTINTSDAREKQDILPITDAVLDAWADVDFVQYQWIASPDKKQFGVIAQQVVSAFASHGLNALDYGLVNYEAGRYGVRYEQAMVLEAALVRREIARMKAQ